MLTAQTSRRTPSSPSAVTSSSSIECHVLGSDVLSQHASPSCTLATVHTQFEHSEPSDSSSSIAHLAGVSLRSPVTELSSDSCLVTSPQESGSLPPVMPYSCGNRAISSRTVVLMYASVNVSAPIIPTFASPTASYLTSLPGALEGQPALQEFSAAEGIVISFIIGIVISLTINEFSYHVSFIYNDYLQV